MRKILTALSAALCLGLPGFAQTAPNINQNYEDQTRTPAKFTHSLATFIGANSITGKPCIVKGDMYRVIAPVSSVTTGATVVGTTLPVTGFGKVGKSIHMRVFGRSAANANTKAINLVFGTLSTALTANAGNAKDFFFDIDIYSTGANAQQVNITGYAAGALVDNLSVTTTQVTTAPINLQVSVPASTGAADVVLKEVTIAADSG